MNTKSDRLESKNRSGLLDLMRVLLCLAVVAFHYLPEKTGLGPFAVNGFLVMSGFLVACGMHAAAAFDVRRFYSRKMRRLAPMFLFALLLGMGLKAVGSALLPATEFLPAHLSGSHFNPVLWADYYNYAGWYMVVEFYLLLAVPFLYYLDRLRWGMVAAFAAGLLLAFILFRTKPRQNSYAAYAGPLYYSPWIRFWQFAGGMLAARLLCRYAGWLPKGCGWLPASLFLLFLLLAFAPLALRTGGLVAWWEYSFSYDVVTTLFFMLMVALLYHTGNSRGGCSGRALQLAADLTYPVFLVHAPLLRAAQWLAGSVLAVRFPGAAEAMALAASLLLAGLMLQAQRRWIC